MPMVASTAGSDSLVDGVGYDRVAGGAGADILTARADRGFSAFGASGDPRIDHCDRVLDGNSANSLACRSVRGQVRDLGPRGDTGGAWIPARRSTVGIRN